MLAGLVGTITAFMRGLHMAATLSLLGSVGFIAWILPAAGAVPDLVRLRLTRIWWISGTVALLAGMAWFSLEAAEIADAGYGSELLKALPIVAAHTQFGNTMMARLGLLLLTTVLSIGSWPLAGLGSASAVAGARSISFETGLLKVGRWRVWVGIATTIVAVGLQGLIGHAGATAGVVGDGLVLSETLHVGAAGLWLGALLPLWISLRILEPARAVAVCERFSPIGLACVLVLAGTGFWQGLQLIGSMAGLFGSAYGRFAVLKITLFMFALVLAVINRIWLTDRLEAANGPARRRDLRVSVGIEICTGLAIVAAAAFMASSPPAAHVVPVWPFSWQFSLVTVNEDPDFRWEVIVSLVAIGTAVALMVASLIWRRFRLVALGVLAVVVGLRGASLKLLTTEAYPTSFQTSPTGFSADSIVRGQALFAQNCVACHGPEGEGNGPAAASLRIKPADLTMPHLWEHSDGEMFWWLTHGIDDPEGGHTQAMPGFGTVLSAEDRWALIDYVRAHNAGLGMEQEEAGFDVPVRAPAFPVTCVGVPATTMADLRGHVMHVVADDGLDVTVPTQAGISTINLVLRDEAKPTSGSCVAADGAALGAYAVLAGMPPDLSRVGFLVDPGGWLRAVRRGGAVGGWPSEDNLIATIRDICANPIKQSSGGDHEHHH